MIRSRNTISAVASALLLALTAAFAAACADNGPTAVVPPNVAADAMFDSYVAIGNSLTAGYQSGGIDDSTQQLSYASLLAQAMKTRYAYASLAGSGCPPPIVNFQTQARLNGGTSITCSLRNANTATALNNVAVPGATSLDPSSVSTSASNTLTTLILGGKTQVAKAADASPTFISAWIGNNDVLGAALSGILVPTAGVSAGVTSQAAFNTNYTALVIALKAMPTLKGAILIGVLNVTGVPALFPVAALQNPAFKAGFDQFAGGTTTILPNCLSSPGNQALISVSILAQMHSGAHPLVIGCAKNSVPGTLVGDIFILDSAEQASLAATVAGYNTIIQGAATANGWAYYDPNPLLVTLKTPGTGCINNVPDLANATAPFGACISLDGIHPTVVANRQLAVALATAINTAYGTTIAASTP